MRRLSLLLILVLSLAFPAVVQASTSYETEVKSGVNFRNAPSTSSKVLRALRKGEDIHVIQRLSTYWLKVVVKDGTVGYVSANPKYTNYKAPVIQEPEAPVLGVKADRVIDIARSYMGKVTYAYGVRDTTRLVFDCSSFTQFIFRQVGVEIPWGTRSQKSAGTYVAKSDLQKGDLVLFRVGSSTSIGHVGIYIGNNQMIHNSPSANGALISSIENGYWGSRYVTARRVL